MLKALRGFHADASAVFGTWIPVCGGIFAAANWVSRGAVMPESNWFVLISGGLAIIAGVVWLSWVVRRLVSKTTKRSDHLIADAREYLASRFILHEARTCPMCGGSEWRFGNHLVEIPIAGADNEDRIIVFPAFCHHCMFCAFMNVSMLDKRMDEEGVPGTDQH